MDGIKVRDVADVSFTAPDLALMRTFLEDFGLSATAESSDDVLYMRGADASPFLHRTRMGPPEFLGLALEADGLSDLKHPVPRGHAFRAFGGPVCDPPSDRLFGVKTVG